MICASHDVLTIRTNTIYYRCNTLCLVFQRDSVLTQQTQGLVTREGLPVALSTSRADIRYTVLGYNELVAAKRRSHSFWSPQPRVDIRYVAEMSGLHPITITQNNNVNAKIYDMQMISGSKHLNLPCFDKLNSTGKSITHVNILLAGLRPGKWRPKQYMLACAGHYSGGPSRNACRGPGRHLAGANRGHWMITVPSTINIIFYNTLHSRTHIRNIIYAIARISNSRLHSYPTMYSHNDPKSSTCIHAAWLPFGSRVRPSSVSMN